MSFWQQLDELVTTFKPHFCRPNSDRVVSFSERHLNFWQWVFALHPGQPAAPFVSIWPRGGGKSTSVELAVAHVAGKQTRRYGLYVSETQLQADTHVGNAGRMLEKVGVERSVTKYGHARSWRRNRLVADGFALDAYGLDAAARGAKIDEMRPDIIILDDVDGAHDSPQVVAKKIHTVTHSLLPAGATSLAVLAVQNLPNRNGVFAQLSDGRAEWLVDRVVSGPYPAVDGLQVERAAQDDGPTRWRITGGTPTWEGQNLEDCERQINTFGLAAFKAESQHEMQTAGGLYERGWFGIVDEYPHEAQLARYWDLAATEPQPGTDPDWTVGLLMAAFRGQFWIVDVQRLRGSPLTVEKRIRQTADQDTKRVAIHIEQEGGSAGPTVIDHYQRTVLAGYAVRGEKKTEDKATRAKPLASAAEAGNVFLVRGAWNGDFLDEIGEVFGGGGGHDDQADAASGAHTVLAPGNHPPGTRAARVQFIEGERRTFTRGGFVGGSSGPGSGHPYVSSSKRPRWR